MSLMLRRNRNVWDPFSEVSELQQEMNRLFSSFMGERLPNGENLLSGKTIPVNLYETDAHLIVQAELPGMRSAKDIEVSVTNDVLSFRAERKPETEIKDEHMHRQELSYGTFRRRLELPYGVKSDGLKASYKNGILEIRLPKREEAKPKQI